MASSTFAGEFKLQLRSQPETAANSGRFERTTRETTWAAKQTAVIVCDVWDYHHCLNAVRRLEEFAPRMNDVLAEARQRGATIIHSPSDCMAAYEQHPARKRAIEAPVAKNQPRDVEHWCSRIPSEEKAHYPIDQSDGGEDDDPTEHAAWAGKLKELGRNPGMPWQRQSNLIEINETLDFISDRGDEVWNILEQRGIQNVILVGVHCNMCVLGRPFGLRQMARNGKRVALMRDMTDSMYNPKRWPFVDHFTGNDLVISHVERFVCPTITSDQILGGAPFRWKSDVRTQHDVMMLAVPQKLDRESFEKQWSLISVPSTWDVATNGVLKSQEGVAWYRCAVRIPQSWIAGHPLQFSIPKRSDDFGIWLNGHALQAAPTTTTDSRLFAIKPEWIAPNDANLIVIRVKHRSGDIGPQSVPTLIGKNQQLPLKGRWQFRLNDDAGNSNIPLPARFGASTDILFEPQSE
ncbi:MAG: beta galactosidase jelly roll domain-containing protein [Planctomycetia bacterium]|nr:beta galactosidase jelly roll domain-containing protein [Planctomycetia bacterium]